MSESENLNRGKIRRAESTIDSAAERQPFDSKSDQDPSVTKHVGDTPTDSLKEGSAIGGEPSTQLDEALISNLPDAPGETATKIGSVTPPLTPDITPNNASITGSLGGQPTKPLEPNHATGLYPDRQ